MPLLSGTQTNIPVETLLSHVAKITSEANTLEGQLTSIYNACVRPANFSGNAADSYDTFMKKWHDSQVTLLQSMRDAAGVLQKLADVTQQNQLLAASAMNV